MMQTKTRSLVFVAVFAALAGSALLLLASAAEFENVEAEQAAVTGSAEVIENEPLASGGQYIEFKVPAQTELRTVTFNPSSETFNNPERGFHRFNQRSPNGSFPSQSTFAQRLAEGHTVLLVVVRLDEFANSAVSPSFLQGYNQMFTDARNAGVKLVILHSYNNPAESGGWNECATFPNEAPLNRVLEHIGQIGSVLTPNADVIQTIHAGFVGAWGEWHCSANGLTEAGPEAQITNALLDATPDSVQVLVRSPWRKARIFSTIDNLSSQEAFSGTNRSRVGFFNDCFLSSADDSGTFINSGGYSLGSADLWRQYIGNESQYVAVGGETCYAPNGSAYWSCTNALAELSRQGWSYLNLDWWPDIINHWQTNGCFNSINQRLGYRLQLEEMQISTIADRGGPLDIRFDVTNTGFAALFNPRPVYVVLHGAGGTHRLPIGGVETRRWRAGETTNVSASVTVPSDVPAGTYSLALWLPDASEAIQGRSEYSIRLANDGVWSAANGWNTIAGTITIR